MAVYLAETFVSKKVSVKDSGHAVKKKKRKELNQGSFKTLWLHYSAELETLQT